MVPSLESVLTLGAGVAAVAWSGLTWHLLGVQRRRDSVRTVISTALAALENPAVSGAPLADRLGQVRHLLDKASREMLMHVAADRDTPAGTFEVLAAYFVERWGAARLEQDARFHRTARDKWRRMTAFRILHRLDHPATISLLAGVVGEDDTELADLGLSLLGQSTDSRAMDILIGALKNRRHPASRVASHIDLSPQKPAARLTALVRDEDPIVRFWGATLLARYPAEAVQFDLAFLVDDVDPRVRKAAVRTLAAIESPLTADCALRLLKDKFAYVRAHAARALGELGMTEQAEEVANLLGDVDWWVRLAAKESLEKMGAEVWPVVMRCLDHSDRFVRNGAAEVIQNLGVLDSLIVMEAASDKPSPHKIALLRRIAAAGGARFTDSLVERAGTRVGARIRHLLSAIGLEYVGAA